MNTDQKVIAFLPCRAGSQRVPHKNTRPFAENEDGLVGIKLDQLLAVDGIDRVVLSSNDTAVLEIAERRVAGSAGKLVIDVRPDHLCSSATSTDEVIAYVPSIIKEGHILWTHVTSPFFDVAGYDEAIAAYREAIADGKHDSLMGVTRLNAFLWDEKGPINYDRAAERWPRTQTIKPVYEVNSAVFIAPIGIYAGLGDRVGNQPLLYELGKDVALDIDWPDDFVIAEDIWRSRHRDAAN